MYHFDRKGTSFVDLSLQKGFMYPFTSLFKNTASLFYSLGNKLDNVAESPHEFWLKRVNESLSTTFWNQKNVIPKSQISLPFHTPQLVKSLSFHNFI